MDLLVFISRKRKCNNDIYRHNRCISDRILYVYIDTYIRPPPLMPPTYIMYYYANILLGTLVSIKKINRMFMIYLYLKDLYIGNMLSYNLVYLYADMDWLTSIINHYNAMPNYNLQYTQITYGINHGPYLRNK
jgi:hypothetical protein